MFLGNDGILGVGAPEIAVTLLVGYFILGPSELYKLTKEIGKFIQSFRTLSSEATKSFESTMENQLELQELRKTQSELTNAFNFRRSINTDQQGEAFSELPPIAEGAAAATATSTTATAAGDEVAKKKKKRRRVKKKKAAPAPAPAVPEDIPPFTADIPDLDLSKEFQNEMKTQLTTNSAATTTETTTTTTTNGVTEAEQEAAARIRSERMDRLQNGQPSTPPDWYSASESDIASEVLSQQQQIPQVQQPSPAESAAEQSRFASQLSGNWNEQILANEDKLSPLGKVMERLAILEEEKNAADARLEEEFRLRADNEERFYREKRRVLEEASAEIAAATYNFDTDTAKDDKKVAVNATISKDSKV